MRQIILSSTTEEYSIDLSDIKTAIVLHLFYEDQMEGFVRLIDEVPSEIDVYVISPTDSYLNSIERLVKRKVVIVKKDNRGRDVSALLVTFGKKVFDYKYVCFVHDKRENDGFLSEDIKMWNRNLQENTIGSAEYIRNVLGTFERNPEIGVMAPPAPLSDHYSTWLGEYIWENVFDRCVELARQLNLNCMPDKDSTEVTIGGVLWFRVDALKKIFERPWAYDDFPGEPMPETGTISHTIERIYPCVAKDAGYVTVNLMNSIFAEDLIEYVQENMFEGMRLIKKGYGIHTISQYKGADARKSRIRDFCSDKKVYIYGNGDYGRDFASFAIEELNVTPAGFLVSDGYKKENETDGIPVYELRDVDLSKPEVAVVVSVKSEKMKKIMESNLANKGCNNYHFDY